MTIRFHDMDEELKNSSEEIQDINEDYVDMIQNLKTKTIEMNGLEEDLRVLKKEHLNDIKAIYNFEKKNSGLLM